MVYKLRKQRRWLVSYSLRSALLFITVLSLWLGLCDRSARRQRDSVRAVLDHGGRVTYDYQTSAFSRLRKSPVPSWLLDSMGRDYFHRVVAVSTLAGDRLGPSAGSDAGRLTIGDLAGLPHLQRLYLGRHSRVDDRGLARLRGLVELRELVIGDGEQITGAGIASLAELDQLRSVTIVRQSMGDEDLRMIARLTGLESLHVEAGERLTDEGVKHLDRLTNLQRLALRAPRVTDRALHSLARMPELKSLRISSDRLTDEGLEVLGQASQLQYLALQRVNSDESSDAHFSFDGGQSLNPAALGPTGFTQAGLMHLTRLKRLRTLMLEPTDADPRWLADAFPECKVLVD